MPLSFSLPRQRSTIAVLSALGLFFLMQLASGYQTTMSDQAWDVASLVVLMAILWGFEAIPVAVTALLPLIVLPLLGVGSLRDFSAGYAHPLIFLFLGAFILALALEKWHLHRRIALAILSRVGTEGRAIIGGFMLIAALLSMGMTNTSTTMMLLPIALSVAALIGERDDLEPTSKKNFAIALVIGVAFGATIGGMATIIGTPPNALVAAFVSEEYGIDIGFTEWLAIGLPLSCMLLPCAWWVLTRLVFRFRVSSSDAVQSHIFELKQSLGELTSAEKRVGLVFSLVIFCWALRPWLALVLELPFLSDAVIALAAAALLFVIPASSDREERLMDWDTAKTLPWAVLLLFGGGLSLAGAVNSSGLALWLGESLLPLSQYGLLVLIIAVTFTVVYLTELTSNLATTATFLPIVAALALQLDISPLILCIPVALAASCAFMLPVATAPNAIVYSSGLFAVADMAKAGMRLNLIAGFVVAMFCFIFLT